MRIISPHSSIKRHRFLCTSSGSGCGATASSTTRRRREQQRQLLFQLLVVVGEAKQLYESHGMMVRRGLDLDNLLLSRFIGASSALGLSDYAYSVFKHRIQMKPAGGNGPDIYLYNTMIKALCTPHYCQPQDAILVYNNIQSLSHLRPDTYSFPFALKAVPRLGLIEDQNQNQIQIQIQVGRQIHCQAIATGLHTHLHVSTALIQMYASCGCLPAARKLFDGMLLTTTSSSSSSWNAIIAAYAKAADLDTARQLFDRMPLLHRNVISWTCLISGYARSDRPSEAIFFFRRMQLEGVEPDEVALLSVLSACARLGALELGEWIHNYIHKHTHRLCKNTLPLNNALIDMYAKSGNIRKATQVFKSMKHTSVVTWSSIISGLALHGLGREALQVFSLMERAQIKPNDITFIALLSACSHVGSVEMGRWYFNIMHSRYGIKPKIEHYGCMIDLLGRSGCLQEAQELVAGMPFEASGAIWGSLLAASRIHGDVELAERSLQHLMAVEPHNSGNYTVLSNVYAGLGRWNESGMMRKVMRDTGVIKVPGGSSIEVNNRVHQFSAGDRLHPQSERIYKLLSLIIEQLMMAGYMPEEHWGMLESEDGCSNS